MNPETIKKDASVSMAKGAAIILMVLAHSHFSHFGGVFINMFHMPLFFFLSGYCFKDTYLQDFKGFAWKRIKGAYWPFVMWGLLFLLLHNFFFSIDIYNGEYGFQGVVSQVYSRKETVRHALRIVLSMSGAEQLLGGYWFLHSYFFASFIAYAAIWISTKWLHFNPVWWLPALLVLCVLSSYFHLGIHDYVEAKELLAAFFILSGYLYKRQRLNWERHPMVVVPLGIGLVVLGSFFWPCSMTSFTWRKAVPYAISAIGGSLMVLTLCKACSKTNFATSFLKYTGDRTLPILTWHFISFKLVSLLVICLYALPRPRLAEFPVIDAYARQGWWILYLTVGIAIPLLLEWLSGRFRRAKQ